MFRSRNFVLAQVLSGLSGAAMFTATNFLPQYTQFARGESAISGGLLLIPMMLGMLDMMVISAIVVEKTGRYRAFMPLGGVLTNAVERTTSTWPGSTGGSSSSTKSLTPSVLHSLPPDVRNAIGDGIMHGLHDVAIGGAVMGVLILVAAWFLKAAVPAPCVPPAVQTEAAGQDLPSSTSS